MDNDTQIRDENLWCVEADKFYTKIIPHHFSLSPSSPQQGWDCFINDVLKKQ